MIEIWREYAFEAAHHLPGTPPNHKCHGTHGHTYHVRVYTSGDCQNQQNWIMDYGDMDAIWEENIQRLVDHKTLNEIEGLSNPTTEVLAQWIWKRLHKHFPELTRIEVDEGHNGGCRLWNTE